MKLTTLLCLFVFAVRCQSVDVPQPYRFNRDEMPYRQPAQDFSKGEAAYWGSVGMLGMGHFLDHMSSRDRIELNPILRDADGRYHESRGILLKGGLVAGLVTIQYFDVKRSPKHRKWWTVFNYAAGSVAYGIALRNRRMR